MRINKRIIIIVFSVFALILCISFIFISHAEQEHSLSFETYIGVIATLIGVCATIIVGFQIFHFIELKKVKEEIDKLDKLRIDIERKSAEVERNLAHVRNGVSSAFRVFYRKFKNDPLAPAACIIAIITYDTTDKKKASETLLGNYQKLYNMISNRRCNITLTRKYVDDLKKYVIDKDLEDYYSICRLHYNIIYLLEN